MLFHNEIMVRRMKNIHDFPVGIKSYRWFNIVSFRFYFILFLNLIVLSQVNASPNSSTHSRSRDGNDSESEDPLGMRQINVFGCRVGCIDNFLMVVVVLFVDASSGRTSPHHRINPQQAGMASTSTASTGM